MRYPAYVAAGWPIGSGVVESANKLVVQARLKGAGMHWARAHVNAMLALRNAVCNQRWNEACVEMQTGQRQHLRQQQRQRYHQRHPQPPVATVLLPPHDPPIPPQQPGEAWRPATSHPWRRAFKPAAALAKQRIPAAKL